MPALPDRADPTAGQDADGVRVPVPPDAGVGVDAGGPRVGVPAVVDEDGQRLLGIAVGRDAEGDRAFVARCVGDWRDPRPWRRLFGVVGPLQDGPDLGHDLREVQGADPRHRGEQIRARVLGATSGDAVLKPLQHGRDVHNWAMSAETSAVNRSSGRGVAGRGARGAGHELGRRLLPRVALAFEEPLHLGRCDALAAGCGRGIDAVEHLRGAGPVVVQQGTLLVGSHQPGRELAAAAAAQLALVHRFRLRRSQDAKDANLMAEYINSPHT